MINDMGITVSEVAPDKDSLSYGRRRSPLKPAAEESSRGLSCVEKK